MAVATMVVAVILALRLFLTGLATAMLLGADSEIADGENHQKCQEGINYSFIAVGFKFVCI